MKLSFKGDIENLKAGIIELSKDLDITLSEDGIKVNVMHKDGSDLCVQYQHNVASITYDKKIHFFRAYSLLVQELRKGNDFSIVEKPQFNLNGPMFDVSQGKGLYGA